MSNQLFYKAFIKHSLFVDWMTTAPVENPERVEPFPEISSPYIFVAPKKYQGTVVEQMMDRMVIAIKQTSHTVKSLFVENEMEWQEILKNLTSQKKIMVFGDELSSMGDGQWRTYGHHELMKTNDLMLIKKQPSLKKETWSHLQNFVGMK